MGFQIKILQAVSAAPLKAARLWALTVLLTGFSGSAMAFNTFHGGLDDPIYQLSDSVTTTPIAKGPSPSMADSCFPLLKSIHQTSPKSAMDRNQRSAGQETAALGLVFGVRFALSSPKKPRSSIASNAETRLDIWHAQGAFAGDRHALAVSGYRQCQKEKALQALGELRWAR